MPTRRPPGPSLPLAVRRRKLSAAPPGPPPATTVGGVGGTCPDGPPPANQPSVPLLKVSISPALTACAWGRTASDAQRSAVDRRVDFIVRSYLPLERAL